MHFLTGSARYDLLSEVVSDGVFESPVKDCCDAIVVKDVVILGSRKVGSINVGCRNWGSVKGREVHEELLPCHPHEEFCHFGIDKCMWWGRPHQRFFGNRLL